MHVIEIFKNYVILQNCHRLVDLRYSNLFVVPVFRLVCCLLVLTVCSICPLYYVMRAFVMLLIKGNLLSYLLTYLYNHKAVQATIFIKR